MRFIFILFAAGSLVALPLTASPQIPDLLDYLHNIPKADFCGEAVPLDDPEVRERFEKEFILMVWDRPQILLYLKRMGRYFPEIEKNLKESNLPDDLKYLAIVESALRPEVGSPKGAIGFWQFVEYTGRKYGLEISESIDERRNLVKSTRAAMRYLSALKDTLGSWALAAAAYNMGEYGLLNEIKRQGVQDYYRLHLSVETQRYLFRIVSAKIILSYPAKYGFQITEEDIYPPHDAMRVTVNLTKSLPIRLVALAAETDFKRIKDLNPEIRGYDLAAGKREILIPPMNPTQFESRFQKMVESWQDTLKSKMVD